jgi:hypothetical protein
MQRLSLRCALSALPGTAGELRESAEGGDHPRQFVAVSVREAVQTTASARSSVGATFSGIVPDGDFKDAPSSRAAMKLSPRIGSVVHPATILPPSSARTVQQRIGNPSVLRWHRRTPIQNSLGERTAESG